MRTIFAVIAFLIPLFLYSQRKDLKGVVIDQSDTELPFTKVRNKTSGSFTTADQQGRFILACMENDSIQLTFSGYDTLIIKISSAQINQGLIQAKLNPKTKEISEINVTRKRMEGFDVGFLPPVKGVQITTGTNSVIELSDLSGAKSTANPREIFAKVPGLNIWESDGAGIQIGIGGRGLSPDRAANFNTRQNGYDISADALGYPESYYTPPMEALRSIEIIRGSASLQFGTQFGGLLNFVIREPAGSTPFEFTTRNTVGTYGYFGTFNRISGTKKRFSYQVYHQYKRGNGYRENSEFGQHQGFAQVTYHLTEKHRIRMEYTHMNYLAHQPGGLTDQQFEQDIQQSFRERNWFSVNWNMIALHYDWEIGKNTNFNIRSFGMISQRMSVGFLEKITMADPGGIRTLIAGDFKNAGIEMRFLKRYSMKRPVKTGKINGAFLVGTRFYKGSTIAEQGNAPDGSDAEFSFLHPNDLENSSYSFPSLNASAFAENILFIGSKWRINIGARYEYISSSSVGFYKQYSIHPVNFDTLAVYKNFTDRSVLRSLPLFGCGISRSVGQRGSLYGNITQNYRAINFTDIRVTNPNFKIDSLIRDEYGFTSELGFRGLIGKYLIYDIAAFYLFYGDKIGLAPKQGTIYKERTNIGDAHNYGLEVFSEFDLLKALNDSSQNSLSLFVNAAYTNATYIRSKEPSYVGKKVEYVSAVILKSGLKFRTGRLTVQTQGSFNSKQFTDATNSVIPSGDAVIGEIPAYLVFDLSARYKFKKYFSVELGVNNFTNQKYFTRRATSYPGPGIIPSDGINGYLTIQYDLSL